MSFYSKIIDLQKLNMAWDRVRKNKPACGVDQITWEMFEENKKTELKQLNLSLANHDYTVMPVKMVTLYKGEKLRQVALYCMRDKVVQQSMAGELVKLYDNTFSDCVYAYRPGKSALTALEKISEKIQTDGFGWALRLDIEHFFDTIAIDHMITLLRRQIREEDTLELIRAICNAPSISDTGELMKKRVGIYQGSAIAPVLSNVVLSEFDRDMEEVSGFYIRYSDDMIILGKERQELERILDRAVLLLEKSGLSVNRSKTTIVSVEEGFDFLGYHFDQKGKAIPARAEAGLAERLEDLWLNGKKESCQNKLKKGAEILGGWEQYFREEREIASCYEFAVIAYMTQNKEVNLTALEERRKKIGNSNHEICMYLYQFWQKAGHRKMMLYEMEDFQEIASLDQDIEINAVSLQELLDLYKKLMAEATEEVLVNIMQIYSDAGAFNKAAAYMDRIARLQTDFERRRKPVIDNPADRAEGERESEAVRLTKAQIRGYMENFVGREDTYVVQELERSGRQRYEQVLEPLTEEVLQRHFKGECTVGTYVQRTNHTAHFMVIDIDISKRILLEAEGEEDKLFPYLQETAAYAGRVQEELKKLGIGGWIEESGYRGYHIWILFTEWIAVRYLTMLQDVIEDRLGKVPDTVTMEFFPDRSRAKKGKAGQAIKLPYGYHAKTGRKCVFLDEDFRPVADPGSFILHMGKYTNIAVKKILNTASPKHIALKENTVDEDISAFGSLSENVALVLRRCTLMRYLSQKARTTGYLSHFERLSVLYVFGHMGEEGTAFVHKVMEFTLNYQYAVTERFIAKCPAKPVSCLKLRDQYQKVTAEYGCNCNFNRTKDCYPSPVLHAIKAGESLNATITVPTSRMLSKEKENKVFEELNIGKRVQGITAKILEMKKQKRGIDKNIDKLEQELERIFDENGIDCIEVEFGMLVRRKKQQGYEWVVEI